MMRAYLLPFLAAIAIANTQASKTIDHTRIELRNFSENVIYSLGLNPSQPCVLDSYVVIGPQGQEVSYFDLLCDRKADGVIRFRTERGRSVMTSAAYIDDPVVGPGYKKFIEGAVRTFTGRGFDKHIPRKSKEATDIQRDFDAVLAEKKRQEKRR